MRASLLFLLLLPCAVFAYKESTHEDMTKAALNASVLADSSQNTLTNIGLKSELTDGKIQKFPGHDNTERPILDLMQWGARFEDDNETKRSLHHFYDPIHNTPADPVLISPNLTSPDWALEDNGDVTSAWTGDQHYSYKEAMEYFYKGLTEQTEINRKKNFGLMFQSLGHVAHHLQDMAQPQHVRNDAHCDSKALCMPTLHYNPSYYEEYTNDNKDKQPIAGLISANSFPIPIFTTARRFWTTQADDSSIPARRGIADFTNRNFVSAGTNFRRGSNGTFIHDAYNLPAPNPTPISRNLADADLLGTKGQAMCNQLKQNSGVVFPSSGCFIDFISSNVSGAEPGEQAINERASTYSFFSKKLNDYDTSAVIAGDLVSKVFTLNEFNFKNAHEYLIPRAVSYSAGLINHFFRGKIDMKPNPGGAGYVIKNLSDEEMQGTFVLYYDHKNAGSQEKLRDPIPSATWNLTIAANSEVAVGSYTVPAGTLSKTLVFSGRIGAENNVHAGKHFGGWSGPMLGLTLEPNASNIRVVTDDYGNAMVAYVTPSATSGYYDLWSRRYMPATGWGSATLIANNVYYNYDYSYNNLVMDANGNMLLNYATYENPVWSVWSRRYNPQTGWGGVTLLGSGNNGTSTSYYHSIGLVMGANGSALGIFTRYENNCPDYCNWTGDLSSRQVTPGSSWSGDNVMYNWSGYSFSNGWSVSGNGSGYGWYWYGWHRYGYGWNGYYDGYSSLFEDATDAPLFVRELCVRSGDTETYSLISRRYVSMAWTAETVLDTFTRVDTQYSSDIGDGYSYPANVCYRATAWYDYYQRLSANGDRVLYYSRRNGNNPVLASFTRAFVLEGGLGAAVSATYPPTLGGYAYVFDVDTDGNGIAVYGAAGGTNGSHIVARHSVRGAGFGDEVELSPVDGSPMIDVSPDGHAAVVWVQQGTNGYELWSNHYTP